MKNARHEHHDDDLFRLLSVLLCIFIFVKEYLSSRESKRRISDMQKNIANKMNELEELTKNITNLLE